MSRTSLALSNLRAAVILIVLAFHSSLAYLASAPAPTAAFDQPPYHWLAFPIVDAQRWLGFDVFCAWQDVSLMSLMFFLSGLLASGSLARKGASKYLTDRIWRIGVPFALAVLLLSPPSFYPAYLTRTADPSVIGFWQQWTSLPFWPSGPEWFLWQLFALNALAAVLYAVWPGIIDQFRRIADWAGAQPLKFFASLIAISALAYVPLALIYSPWNWSEIGPFSFQLSRPAHYVVYFFAGAALGSRGLDRGLLACDSPLAKHWRLCLGAAVLSFAIWAGLTSLTLPDWNTAPIAARLAASLAFPVACTCVAMFLLAGCLRFASRVHIWALDSLSANAYSIYLVHYVFVVWLQYALLGSDLIPVAKAAIVLAGTLIVSWASTAAFARIVAGPPFVAAKRAVAPLTH